MNLRGNPQLMDRLAAEFVLGTLRGSARARFQRLLREDAALRRTVAEWQARLAPMAAAVAPAQPPARVWEAIADRIAAPRQPIDSRWFGVTFWRGLALASGGAAAALLAAVTWFMPEPYIPAPAPQIVQLPSRDLRTAYYAVLSDPKTQKPVLLAAAARDSNLLMIKRLDDSIMVEHKSLQLWALPAGEAPRSLGLVAEEEKHTLRLAARADRTLNGIPTLAISLEPSGGSPTGAPTGPVLYTGPCIRTW